jgi:hypothetical protein
MTERELDEKIAGQMGKVADRPHDADNTTEAEVQAIRDRIFVLEPGIVFIHEIPQQTPFTVEIERARLFELAAAFTEFILVIDLTKAARPTAEIRNEIGKIISAPGLAHTVVFTGKNILLNAAARFVFASVFGRGNFTLLKSCAEALSHAHQLRANLG